MTRRVIVEADGGSRGNPGPAAYGAVVRDGDTGEVLLEVADAIGTASNNVAEYRGVIAGLTAALELGATDVSVRLDSKLVVEQLSGRWQIRHPDMVPLAARANALARRFGAVEFSWMPRASNTVADRLVNEALDDAAAGRPWRGSRAGVLGRAIELPSTDLPGMEVPVPEPRPDVTSLTTNRLPGFMPDEGPPTTFVAVRHGVTAYTIAKRFCGSTDVALNEAGVAMAEAAAQRLVQRAGVSSVVTSPLSRTRATAEIIAAAIGAEVHTDGDLRECDFGAWEGLTFAEAQQRYPDEVTAWLADPTVAPPGGESFAAVRRRVTSARDRIVAEFPGSTVAVVSHVTPIKTLANLAMDAPLSSVYRLHIEAASITEMDWYADGPAVLRVLNETAHLRSLI
ncbi:MAG: ribonuclease / adenosylcobalamin/alpha-ribazole phosphatase [Frankiaceae bacterium]|nr:ribonuclease / adenosylcobalamin/alpha-ribazole phosphatase [Frankiaceae bacterium]